MTGKIQAIEELSGVPLRELRRRIADLVGDVRMIVFGSYSRGDFESDSDIDLLIIIKDDVTQDMISTIHKIMKEFRIHQRVAISAIILKEKELKRGPYPIVKKSEEEGIEVE